MCLRRAMKARPPLDSVAALDLVREHIRAHLPVDEEQHRVALGRAGLLLAGDLEVAKKVISGEKATPDLTATDKMKDLLVFSVGPEYAALRQALGVSIKVD